MVRREILRRALILVLMKHATEEYLVKSKKKTKPAPDQEQMMSEALADWMFGAILDIGCVDDDTRLDEVAEVVMDFVWPENEETQMASFMWMMNRYDLAMFSSVAEKRWDYILMSNGEYRRFVGTIE